MARIDGQPALHPVCDVLRYAAHDSVRRVHVGINQPRQQGMPASVDHLARGILRLQIRGGTNCDNRVAAHRDGAVRQIPDAQIAALVAIFGPGQRKHVGVNQ